MIDRGYRNAWMSMSMFTKSAVSKARLGGFIVRRKKKQFERGGKKKRRNTFLSGFGALLYFSPQRKRTWLTMYSTMASSIAGQSAPCTRFSLDLSRCSILCLSFAERWHTTTGENGFLPISHSTQQA